MSDPLQFSDSKPTRSDAVRNRELLLQTAARLIDEKGAENVTMSEVASEAGVGKGTLYRHFSNKTDLCYALLDQDQSDLQARTLRRLRESGNLPLDDLSWFLGQVVGFVLRNIDMLHAVGESSQAGTIELNVHQWWRLTIRGLLVRAEVAGDVDYKADVLYVMLDVMTIHYQYSLRGYDQTRIIDGLHSTMNALARSE